MILSKYLKKKSPEKREEEQELEEFNEQMKRRSEQKSAEREAFIKDEEKDKRLGNLRFRKIHSKINRSPAVTKN